MGKSELSRCETVAVYELERGMRAGAAVYRVSVSLRGHEGVMMREWPVGPQGLTEGQYLDLSHWLLASVARGVVPVDGVAQALPM